MTHYGFKNKWSYICDGLSPQRSDSIDLSRSFYRFMSEDNLLNLFKGYFTLKNPGEWEDPYEKIVVNGDYSAIGFKKPATYAACFTKIAHGDAQWKMYTKGNERCFRVEFDLNNLIGAFCLAYPFSPGPHLYVGDVSYALRDQSIRAIGKKHSKYHKAAFPKHFGDEDYVDLLLLKRPSFKWEEESRLIVLTNEDQGKEIKLCYTPDVVRSFIKSVEIDPKCSIDEFKIIDERYKKLISAIPSPSPYSYEIIITRSTLYDPVTPVVVQYK